MKEKVILLFSGGLDTSFCVLHLIEKGYEVITLTLDTGGISKEEVIKIEERAKELGAIKHYTFNIEDEVYDTFISKIIKSNGLYQGIYPLMCSDRFLFGKYAIELAKKENAVAIAHGCTPSGNDQIRIEAPVMCSSTEFKIITPIKELGITRDDEIKYLEDKGFTVSAEVKKYTLNENIFGITISGSEIDENKEIHEDAWVISNITKTEPEYVEIEFKKGAPITLNGIAMPGIKILKKLNKIAGAHGYGKGIYVEDETLGIKGRQAFEAPGIILLINVHKALEKLTLTKKQISLKNSLDYQWADLAYTEMFSPIMKNIEAFIDSTQQTVNGTVKVKLSNNSMFLCEVSSSNGLVDTEIAEYAQNCKWGKVEVDAFLKFYTLQSKIFYKKNKLEVL